MKFESIDDCFAWLRDGYSFSEPLLDAINAHKQSKECLEKLFDEQLWLQPDHDFENETDKEYYIGLCRIEELLVKSGLIYND